MAGEGPSDQAPPDAEVLELLRTGELVVVGRVASASNVTLLCRVSDDPAGRLAVYKPVVGEAPLWDFPDGTLHRRELAAYLVDRMLGWAMVPPTVVRDDGPLGRGSAQLFVAHDPDRHYFALVEQDDADIAAQLRRMVAFDLVVNNADRKGSHVLVDDRGRLWLVDHGVTFHAEHKLRTVAWDFAGEPVPVEVRAAAGALAERLAVPDDPGTCELAALLDLEELRATQRRAEAVSRLERFPAPRGPRPYPWPPL